MMEAQDRLVYLYEEGKIPYYKANDLGDKTEYDTDSVIRRKSTIQKPNIEIFYPSTGVTDTMPSILICPGGGYSYLSHRYEGVELARWFAQRGIVGVVLNSRLPDDRVMTDKKEAPLKDALSALELLRNNAKEYKINPNKVGIMGFSAGGHLAGSTSVLYTSSINRPNISILIYPVLSLDTLITHGGSRRNLIGKSPSNEDVYRFSLENHVNAQTPSTFILHTMDDRVVPVENSLRYIAQLSKFKVKNCESHILPNGGHGYAIVRSEVGQLKNWPDYLQAWLENLAWIKKK
jgi:acetyl esterase/lipase